MSWGDHVHFTARVEYAMRAAMVLAAIEPALTTAARLAEAQDLPFPYLGSILTDLRRAGIVRSYRGSDGGYTLARPAAEISLGDVVRAINGPLNTSHLAHGDFTVRLFSILDAASEAMFEVIDQVSLADVITEGGLERWTTSPPSGAGSSRGTHRLRR